MEVKAISISLMRIIFLVLLLQKTGDAKKAGFPLLHPNRLQFFEFEPIQFKCEGLDVSSEWRVMMKLKEDPTSVAEWKTSTGSMTISLPFTTDSGEYWCENEEGERSNSINITVTDGDVILESPSVPVMEGHSVSLNCRKKMAAPDLTADFFKDGRPCYTGYKGYYTINNVSKSDEGFYKCSISGAGESPESRLAVRVLLTLLNTYSAQTNDDAFPHIEPNRLQFFTYESIQLDCKRFTGSTEWRVMKNTSSGASRWEDSTTSKNIKPTFGSHNEEYWCQNGEGERSRSLNISIVEADSVILESPVLPVMEGQTVTLRCRRKTEPHDLTADFYKDGKFKKTGYAGDMIIHSVSKSDEGLYKCNISGYEESPNIRLAVRERHTSSTEEIQESTETPSTPGSSHPSILLPVVFTIETVAVLLLVIGLLYYGERSVSGERGDDVMSVVTYTALTEDLKKKGQ